MEDCQLIRRYRLNHGGITLVVNLVRDAITSPTNRNNYQSGGEMFGNTLLFDNRKNATLQCRQFRNIATICQSCHKSINALSRPHTIQQFNRFPLENQKLHRIKANFMAIAGVVAAIDGTHIKIIAPSTYEDVFVNRKKVHSNSDCF